jgi:adenosine deaminase
MGRPLADLHRHLDGSIRPTTLHELAARTGREVPDDLLFTARMGLAEALARFAFTVTLLQEPEAVERVAAEMCEDAVADEVSTLEIRFAPHLHQNGSIEEVVDAALAGIDGRANLLLCTLYGNDPEVVGRMVDVAATRPGVVGIDLAGGPAPTHAWRLADYAPAFRRAAEHGLGRTVHAAEGRPPQEIRTAVEVLGAQRIGHGTTLLDDPEVVALVVECGVTIEACPTSNVHTGVIDAVTEHPLRQWLDAGVKVCVCTDNTLLSDVNASEELRRVSEIPGMTAAHLHALVQHGHDGAFRQS